MQFSKVLLEISAKISADKIVSLSPVVKGNFLSVSGVYIVMVQTQQQISQSIRTENIGVFEQMATSWIPGFKAGIGTSSSIYTIHSLEY